MKLTVDELKMIHAALIARERILREDWIPAWEGIDSAKVETLKAELVSIPSLSARVCAAYLSLELGFEIQPVAAA